ncbi:MAG: S1 RNA-binding domain-containing protein [Ruminococcaceae bacterium]|nr:S1 RNA-binding domain-containing protein [Oscillospiraceae bacterium]
MDLTVGAIIEGKVKSITNFGAFIALPENRTGMVHISEVANTYVNDIRQHLTEGQEVKVMVIAIDPTGKINLSIKRLESKPTQQRRNDRGDRGERTDRGERRGPSGDRRGERRYGASEPQPPAPPKSGDQAFEDLLKQFMTESDSKISSMRQYNDHRTKNRRR